MKVERFVKEYASYKLKSINSNQLIQKELKTVKVDKINSVIKYRKNGIITADEAIKMILEA